MLKTINGCKYEGVEVKIGQQMYLIPALSIRQIAQYKDAIEKSRKMEGDLVLQLPETIDFIHAAISRNYPAVTREELQDAIDINNYRFIVRAIFGVSGLVGELKPVPASEQGAETGVTSQEA